MIAKPHSAVLMSDAGERYLLSEIKISREQSLMAFAAVNVAFSLIVHQVFEFVLQPFMRFEIVWGIRENDVAVLIYRDTIFRPRQVFGGKPKIQRVLCHLVECKSR